MVRKTQRVKFLRKTGINKRKGQVGGRWLVQEFCLITLVNRLDLEFKVAERSFQVPMPNSPLLLNYLCFGAHFLHESRLITDVFILAFLLRCVLLPWQRDWLKTRLK